MWMCNKLSNEVRGGKRDTESKQESVCIKAHILRVKASHQWSKLTREMTRGLPKHDFLLFSHQAEFQTHIQMSSGVQHSYNLQMKSYKK